MLNQVQIKRKKIKINEAKKKKTFFSKDWLYQYRELNGQIFFF